MTTTEVGAATVPKDVITACDKVFGGGSAGFFEMLAAEFDRMELAEDEIRKAQIRHPAHRDRLWHSFSLLKPNMGLKRMASELVYRAHCRELLERVVAGTDTRSGTAAEVCCVVLETGELSPLTSAAVGLHLRMWEAAGLPAIDGSSEARVHYEALKKSVIDDHERVAREKVAVKDRRLGAITCRGLHHGKMVKCAYLPPGHLVVEG